MKWGIVEIAALVAAWSSGMAIMYYARTWFTDLYWRAWRRWGPKRCIGCGSTKGPFKVVHGYTFCKEPTPEHMHAVGYRLHTPPEEDNNGQA